MKVINEKLATRCEVCHQSDRFDANNNYCLRCSSYDIKKLAKPVAKIRLLWVRLGFRYVGMILGGLLGIFAPDCGNRYMFLDPFQAVLQRSFRMLFFGLFFMLVGLAFGTAIGECFRETILAFKRFLVKSISKKPSKVIN